MERPPGLVPLVLLGLLAGGALVPHLAPGGSSESAASSSEKNTATDRPAAPLGDEGAEPFVKLLAEFFGREISEAALVRDARHYVRALASADALVARRDAARFVRCFFDLDLDATPAQIRKFHDVVRALGTCDHPASSEPPDANALAATLGPFVESYGALDAVATPSKDKAAELKPHLKALRDDAAASARRTMAFVKMRAAARVYFHDVRFVVATVPDPIDSHAGWQFDPTLAAIEEAAGADHYVLDRFYFPDADAAAPNPANGMRAAAKAHDTEPGVVLFRYDEPHDGWQLRKLLVVFVVTETPTSGINPRAFSAAVRAAAGWEPSDPRPLLVLGPYFSGTSQSIAHALADLRPDLGGRDVRLISGSATSDANKQMLESESGPGARSPWRVTFHATVHPDSAITGAMYEYLKTRIDPEIGPGRRPRIARLLESNTAYGVSSEIGLIAPKHGAYDPGEPKTLHPLDPDSMQANSIELRFPLHISRLRSDTRNRAAPGPAAGVVSRFRPLTLGDESRPTDQLPIFAPQTTASYVELVLSKILDTIRRERIGIVGILATDARDKLFLARQIIRDCPNVVLFTTESDLLFAHPDYYGSTAGMLIAAPYPLYNRNQVWSDDETHSRRQFATSSVQGVYNAMLALLNYDDTGRYTAIDEGARLVEYSPVDGACDLVESVTDRRNGCTPPVWISVVGRDMPWPVRAAAPAVDPNHYLFSVQSISGSRTDRRALVPTSSVLLFLVVAVVVVGHIAVAYRYQDGPDPHLYLAPDRRPPIATDRHLYVAAASMVLMIPWLLASWMAMNWSISELKSPFAIGLLAAALVAVFIGLEVLALRRVTRGAGALLRRPGWMVGFSVVAWGVYGLIRYLANQNTAGSGFTAAGPMFIERAAAVTSGVSPAVPVLGLSAALYLWTIVEVRRLSRPRILPDGGYEYVDGMLDGGLHNFSTRLSYLARSILAVPWQAIALLAAGALVAFTGAGFNPIWSPLRSVDGPQFGAFVTSLLMVLQLMIVAALIQFLYLWFGIAAVLERLGAHPAVDAYRRVPRKLFPGSVVPQVPRLSELEEPVRRWIQLKNGEVDATADNLATLFRDDMRRDPDVAWSHTATWRQLLLEAKRILDDLNRKWARAPHGAPRPQFVSLAGIGIGGAAGSLPTSLAPDLYAVSQPAADPHGSDRALMTREEEFVVLPVVYMIRAVLARMWDNVLFVIGAILILLVTHASYPFQMNRRLEGFLWTDVAASVAAILFVFVKMERDEVLSNIRSTTPGQIKWDRDFIVKLLVYGLIPVAGLFATEFPDLGGTVLGWIEPVRKALP